jgi:AcrR family transcriptional regulator
VPDKSSTRERRREATRQRIAEAASRRFARHGYDRTTIRAVAADAHVDPALVLHYFGSKERLFARVSAGDAAASASGVRNDGPVDATLTALAGKLGDLAPEVLAGLRSMLTHPSAAHQARTAFEQQAGALAARLDGPDAETRAALLLAANLGIAVARELLDVPSLMRGTPEELLAAYRPAVEALCASG